jgi:hypothetical protein
VDEYTSEGGYCLQCEQLVPYLHSIGVDSFGLLVARVMGLVFMDA